MVFFDLSLDLSFLKIAFYSKKETSQQDSTSNSSNETKETFHQEKEAINCSTGAKISIEEISTFSSAKKESVEPNSSSKAFNEILLTKLANDDIYSLLREIGAPLSSEKGFNNSKRYFQKYNTSLDFEKEISTFGNLKSSSTSDSKHINKMGSKNTKNSYLVNYIDNKLIPENVRDRPESSISTPIDRSWQNKMAFCDSSYSDDVHRDLFEERKNRNCDLIVMGSKSFEESRSSFKSSIYEKTGHLKYSENPEKMHISVPNHNSSTLNQRAQPISVKKGMRYIENLYMSRIDAKNLIIPKTTVSGTSENGTTMSHDKKCSGFLIKERTKNTMVDSDSLDFSALKKAIKGKFIENTALKSPIDTPLTDSNGVIYSCYHERTEIGHTSEKDHPNDIIKNYRASINNEYKLTPNSFLKCVHPNDGLDNNHVPKSDISKIKTSHFIEDIYSQDDLDHCIASVNLNFQPAYNETNFEARNVQSPKIMNSKNNDSIKPSNSHTGVNEVHNFSKALNSVISCNFSNTTNLLQKSSTSAHKLNTRIYKLRKFFKENSEIFSDKLNNESDYIHSSRDISESKNSFSSSSMNVFRENDEKNKKYFTAKNVKDQKNMSNMDSKHHTNCLDTIDILKTDNQLCCHSSSSRHLKSNIASDPMGESTLSLPAKHAAVERVLSDKAVDVQVLGRLAFGGLPTSLRPRCWQLLLANLGNDESRCERYNQLITVSKPLDSICKQIGLDIARLSADLREKSQPLMRILKTFASARPSVGYVQGTDTVLGVFAKVFEIDSFAKEAAVYFAYQRFMDQRLEIYSTTQSGINKQLFIIKSVLERVDPALARHFMDLGIDTRMYAFRWINCVFTRDFNHESCVVVFDSLLGSSVDFLAFLSVSFVLHLRNRLIGEDFETCMDILLSAGKKLTLKDTQILLASAYVHEKYFYQN